MLRASLLVASVAAVVVLQGSGCGGTSGSGASCPADPQCYVAGSDGSCAVDPDETCASGAWQCSTSGKLGSGCLPDGGIAPPPVDAGACPLSNLQPPLACNDDSTCAPYGGHCVFEALNGPGDCICGSGVVDSGPAPDVCVLDCNGDICTLPSFTITCKGADDSTTCAQYNAICVPSSGGGPQFECTCLAEDPPHGATGN
jgi:hypothetical protein